MRKLYTVAFPSLGEEDARIIAGIRARHDRQVSVLGPHFTLLFACDAVDEAIYVDHVRTIAASTVSFPFTCLETEPDEGAARGVVYLVPDLGRNQLTTLHDRLYTGPMAPHLRHDVQFVAHMTVGHAADVDAAAALCDAINADGIDIAGTIDALVVGCVEHGRFVELARFALRH
ncbi:2'-5' RNA ligase family protein [Scleromatobacter humisilvae]|uniref:2'-5' RNA ligase family protein n=1 Tax=Scleromatobacter humisilvae TaxID=2897159 RepID=A0A9X2C0F1_9BURK|nr:2'-5' RNA ligase family protein [Scleromatobacter humisilvae]MCK9684694.1 2'-5' RNA ligase family protein [Scleromatobacter humisilvae]